MIRIGKGILGTLLAFGGWIGLQAGETIKAEKGWESLSPAEESGYRLTSDGKSRAALSLQPPVQREGYYRLDWQMRSTDVHAAAALSVNVNGAPSSARYPLAEEWNSYSAYFYSKTDGSMQIRLFPVPGAAQTLSVRRIRLMLCPPVNADGSAPNRIPQPDLEDCRGAPGFWLPYPGAQASDIRIGSAEGYLAGERSLAVVFPANPKGASGIVSRYLPVVPGEICRCSFWAKADADYPVNAGVSIWLPNHREKLFRVGKSFVIGTGWKRYEFEVPVPADISEYPDLAEHMVTITLRGVPDKAGQVFFDDLSFQQILPAK